MLLCRQFLLAVLFKLTGLTGGLMMQAAETVGGARGHRSTVKR